MGDNSDRSAIAEQKSLPIDVRRMAGLETAAKMLGGQSALADELLITPRAIRLKVNAERGISNVDIIRAAKALEALAARLLSHAAKLRALT